MHTDSSKVFAEPDPREVSTIAGGLLKIDRVLAIWVGFRGDAKFGVVNFLN